MATSGRYLYAIRIEGIGDNTASTFANKLYRWTWARTFFDVAGTSDPDSLYIPALLRWPRELEFSVDFRRGEPTMGSLTFELRRTTDVLTQFWAGVPARVAKLNGAVTASATSIILDTASLTGVIYLGREAIKLGTESPSKTYAVTRGQLQTSAHKHDDNVQAWAALHPTSLVGRLVEVIRVPLDSAGEPTEEVRWTGILRRLYAAGTTSVTLEADNLLAKLKATHIYRDPWRWRWGSQEDRELSLGRSFRAGYGSVETTERALVIIDDKYAEVVSYKSDSTGAYAVGHASRRRFDGSPPVPNDFDFNSNFEVREFFSTHPQAPANNATPAANTLPLQSDPGKLILQLLLSTENAGVIGTNHATYDTGIDELAASMPSATIDVTAFERWGANQTPLIQFHLGHESAEPVDLYELIQGILRARGATLTQTDGGLLSVVTWSDAIIYGSANTISQAQVVSVGDGIVQDRRLEDVLERVQIEYDDRVGIGPDSLEGKDVVNERLVPRGAHDTMTLSARGLEDRDEATILLQSFISRYHEPIIEWQLECLSTADFWPGDVIQLTHDKLWAGSAQGVTSVTCLVAGRREALDEQGHSIRYRLWYVGEVFGAIGYIAPSAEVASWSSGASAITIEANVFTSSSDAVLATDAAGFAVDDVCQLTDQFGTVRDAGFIITNIAGNVLTVSGMGVTPAGEDIIRVAKYDAVVSQQQADWAFVAEADGTLDSDTAKDWTT